MLVVMSKKFWEKHVEKLVVDADYVGIDGENYGLTGSGSDDSAIASRYSNVLSAGGFTPEGRLYSMLRKMKKGEDINPRAVENEISYFLDDPAFISSAVKAFRGLYCMGYSHHINVFVILPNMVYKFMSEAIIEKMIEIIRTDYRFVYSQEELKSIGYKKLAIPLKPSMLREIEENVKRIEKRYKIKYKKKYDWEDDD